VSNVIDTSPIINVIDWKDTVCTVDYTNFLVRACPRGMVTVLTVDPKAKFIERFSHLYGVNAALIRSREGWTDRLNTVIGYRRFYDYCASNAKYESKNILHGVTTGFLFEVDCHKDSPLVGWFLVLGVKNG
jgi:hypothetical protein